MSVIFTPGPPRLMAQFLEHEPVELIRGYHGADVDALVENMDDRWQVWELRPNLRLQKELRKRSTTCNRLHFTPEERGRLVGNVPFNPGTPPKEP